MSSEQIKAAIAPCGLNCEKCFAHADGDIRQHSLELKEKLGNFIGYAKRFETMFGEPVFQHYPAFREFLDYLASGNCRGCRNEQCRLFKTCGVRRCHQEKRVDYCAECDEFPCDRTGFDHQLQNVWVRLNEKIRENGMNCFYETTRTAPRYI